MAGEQSNIVQRDHSSYFRLNLKLLVRYHSLARIRSKMRIEPNQDFHLSERLQHVRTCAKDVAMVAVYAEGS